jgi:hypothetical protein
MDFSKNQVENSFNRALFPKFSMFANLIFMILQKDSLLIDLLRKICDRRQLRVTDFLFKRPAKLGEEVAVLDPTLKVGIIDSDELILAPSESVYLQYPFFQLKNTNIRYVCFAHFEIELDVSLITGGSGATRGGPTSSHQKRPSDSEFNFFWTEITASQYKVRRNI